MRLRAEGFLQDQAAAVYLVQVATFSASVSNILACLRMLLQLRQRVTVTVAAQVLVCCLQTFQLYAPAAAIAALFAVCVELESELKKNVWLLTIMVTDTAMHTAAPQTWNRQICNTTPATNIIMKKPTEILRQSPTKVGSNELEYGPDSDIQMVYPIDNSLVCEAELMAAVIKCALAV